MINDQISKMEARIDKTLDYIYSPESLPNDVLGEEAANFIDQYRGLIKAEIMRNFLIESGFWYRSYGLHYRVVMMVFRLTEKNASYA